MSFEIALTVATFMLVGNAYFVGAEFGLISARRSNIELKAKQGSRPAKITLGAMENITLMLAGAQLGVTICSLILGAVGEPLFAHLLESPLKNIGLSEFAVHSLSFALALSFMVYLHVVLGEMVPKNLALANPTKTALILTPPLVFIVKLIRPLVNFLNSIANLCVKKVGIAPKNEIASAFTRDEVSGFVEESKREGLIEKNEGALLTKAIDLHENTIHKAVIPLNKLVVINKKTTPEQLEMLSAKTGYSRFPIVDKNSKPTHYIHLKDVLGIRKDQYRLPIPAKAWRPISVISSRATMRTALAVMQKSGAHLASVDNKNEQIIGIITLEDLLEEFVGEIRDDSKTTTNNKT